MPEDEDGDDDNCDAPDAVYADLRRYVPAHPRAAAHHAPGRTPVPPQDSRVGVMEWLSAFGHMVLRRVRRA